MTEMKFHMIIDSFKLSSKRLWSLETELNRRKVNFRKEIVMV